MKYLFLLIVLGFSLHVLAQDRSQKGSWEIVSKMYLNTEEEASEQELQELQEQNRQLSQIRIIEYLSSTTYNSFQSTIESVTSIINKEGTDYFLYTFADEDDFAVKMPYKAYLEAFKDLKQKTFRVTNVKKHASSNAEILGYKTKVITYDVVVRGYENVDAGFTVTTWYTPELPSTFNKYKSDFPGPKIPGFPLKTSIKDNDEDADIFSITTEAIEVNPIAKEDLITMPPERYQVFFANNKKELDAKKLFEKDTFALDTAARDSILNVVEGFSRRLDGGSEFNSNWARVQSAQGSKYINSAGEYCFDEVLDVYPLGVIRRQLLDYTAGDSVVLVVRKGDKVGMIDYQSSQWLLPAAYDRIEKQALPMLKVYNKGQVGYVSAWGKELLPIEFDEALSLDGDKYFGVQKAGKWGVYSSTQQEIVVPAKYDKLDFCGGCDNKPEYLYLLKKDKWGIVSFENEVLLPFEYDFPSHSGMSSGNWVTNLNKGGAKVVINLATKEVYLKEDYEEVKIVNGFLALKRDGQYALVNTLGEQLSGYEYEEVEGLFNSFYDGGYVKVIKGGKEGVMDKLGNIIIAPDRFDYISISKNEDAFLVYDREREKVGLYSLLGEELLATEYTEIYSAHDAHDGKSVFYLKNEAQVGWYGLSTKSVIQPQFENIQFITAADSLTTYVLVGDRNNKGLFTISGEQLVSTEYTALEFVSPTLLKVKKEDQYGLFDLNEPMEVLPAEYQRISWEDESAQLFRLLSNRGEVKRESWYDGESRELIEFDFPEVSYSGATGLWIASDGDELFLYNGTKRKSVSQKYEDIKPFFKGVALVYNKGKYGYINGEGEEVVPCIYDEVSINEQGYKILSTREYGGMWKTIFVDAYGLALIAKEFYSESAPLSFSDNHSNSGLIKFKEYHKKRGEDLYGMISLFGEVIIEPEYEKITTIAGGKAFVVSSDSYYGVIHANGKTIMPTVLDRVFTNQYVSFWFQEDEENMKFPLVANIESLYFYITEDGGMLPVSFGQLIEFRN